MDAFISGAWRTPTRGEVFANGDWRKLTRAEMYRSGVWRSVLSFAQPLSVNANNINARATNRGKPVTVTGTSTCTPVGGVAPFSYQWLLTSGEATIGAPTSATTQIYDVVQAGGVSESTASVTCTDSAGNVASKSISITLTNEGF